MPFVPLCLALPATRAFQSRADFLIASETSIELFFPLDAPGACPSNPITAGRPITQVDKGLDRLI
jgi:hypothetical protein